MKGNMSIDINTNITATDRTAFCTQIYAHLCVAEANAEPVAFTGVRFHDGIPLRDGSQTAHSVDMEGVLGALRSYGGYTSDVASFTSVVNKTHTNGNTGVVLNIVIKRMSTAAFALQKSIGNKAFRVHMAATYGKSWWDSSEKPLRVEAQLCAILLDGLDIYPQTQEATPIVATVVATPAPAQATAPATDLANIMASLGITPAAPAAPAAVAAPTQVISATKADLVAAIVSRGIMSEREASALNKDTLTLLLA